MGDFSWDDAFDAKYNFLVAEISMGYRLEFRDVFAAWDLFVDGIVLTLLLSGIAMVGGLVIGVLLAAARVYGPPVLRRAVIIYVELIRNTPLLVQLFLIYFGAPSIGLRLDAFMAASIVLVINLAAYMTEIIRAGFGAIPKTEVEAGASLGLSGFEIFRYIVLFQAIKHMTPALVSQFVLFMLATAAVSQISVPDLFHIGSIVQSRTFRDLEVYVVVGAIYLGLGFIFRVLFLTAYHFVFGRQR
jgi:polar amino acid transport system permease protein